jgi:hypothetical protein
MQGPQRIPLYGVPHTVAVETPGVRTHESMMVNDRVVLLAPATGEVVADCADAKCGQK